MTKNGETNLLTLNARWAERVGASSGAVRAGKGTKESPSKKDSHRDEYEWHVKPPIKLMHNPLMTEKDATHPENQELYVKITLASDSLWAALMEKTPDSFERVAKTRDWYGSFDPKKSPQHHIASRILVQKTEQGNATLPTLNDCIKLNNKSGGVSATYHYPLHGDKSETYEIEGACIIRNGVKVPINGAGEAAAIGIFTGAADMHGNNFAIRDNGASIDVCKFDNKYGAGTSSNLEASINLSFFKARVLQKPVDAMQAKLEALKNDVAVFAMEGDELANAPEQVKERHKALMACEAKDPHARHKLLGEISRLECEMAHVLDPMQKAGDIEGVLKHIFDPASNHREETNGVGGRQVFKCASIKEFAAAGHVRKEFLDTVYLITHMPQEKLRSMVINIIGEQSVSPVTKQPVAVMVADQLMDNMRDMANAVEHCPEYQTHVQENQKRLDARMAVVDTRLDAAIRTLGTQAPKSVRKFSGEVEPAKKAAASSGNITTSSEEDLTISSENLAGTSRSKSVSTGKGADETVIPGWRKVFAGQQQDTSGNMTTSSESTATASESQSSSSSSGPASPEKGAVQLKIGGWGKMLAGQKDQQAQSMQF